MAISADEVLHVALLGRIRLDADEVGRFADQLSDVLNYVEKLQALDTEGVEPLAHPLPLRNVLRADEPRPSLPSDVAVAGAPDTQGAFFRVPRVLDDGSSA